MGVRGLTTYLHQDSRNFQDYKLHNTTLIIDAANFICNLYFNSTLYTQFNGEYTALLAFVAEFIDCLNRCAVRPIFIFDGCHQPMKIQTQLQRNKFRLQTCKSLNVLLNSSSKKAIDPSFRISLLPPLILTTLAHALTLLDVEFVTSDRESDQDAICLATHFNCPVLSGDSDFFITIPNSHDGVCFLPMRYFNTVSITNSTKCNSCTTTNKICCFIRCKKFLPNGPGLNNLPFSLRPLLACLLGNDYIHPHIFSRCFPVSNERSTPLSKAATKDMILKRRRSLIHALIKWMCAFNGDVERIIKQLMSRYPTSERPKLRILLTEGMRAYCTNTQVVLTSFSRYLDDGDRFDVQDSDFDSSDSDIPSNINYEMTSSSCCDDASCQASNVDDEDVQDDLLCTDSQTHSSCNTKQENNTAFVQINPEEYFVASSNWPGDMVDGFRKFQIIPTFIDPIFSQASILTCFTESLYDRKSVHSSSTYIRTLIYGLVLGIEYRYMPNHPDRLIGVKKGKDRHSVTEYDRIGSRDIKPKKIYFEPIILDKTCDTYNKFTEIHFGTSSISTNLEWLRWLAVMVVIYHRSSPEASCDITSSATALSLGLITICSYLNEKRLFLKNIHAKVIRKHYSMCSKLLNPAKNKQLKLESCNDKLDIHIIHAYGELQVIYLALTTLGSILNFVVSDKAQCSNKCIPLPSIPVIFPSGYLFHQVCLHMKSLVPSERLAYAAQLVETLLYSDKTRNDLPEANNLFQSYLSELVDVQTHLKIPAGKTNEANLNTCRQHTSKPEQPSKTSKYMRKTHQGKGEQALIEERISRLMLDNGLSD